MLGEAEPLECADASLRFFLAFDEVGNRHSLRGQDLSRHPFAIDIHSKIETPLRIAIGETRVEEYIDREMRARSGLNESGCSHAVTGACILCVIFGEILIVDANGDARVRQAIGMHLVRCAVDGLARRCWVRGARCKVER